jgi:hypothetical protein
MPVVTVAPNDALLEKLKSNMQEVRARGGVLYVLADADTRIESSEGVHVIRMPEHYGPLSPLLHVVPLQLLAYHTACARGTDVDKPRNLAKSVTVEAFFGTYTDVTPPSRLSWTNEESDDGAVTTVTFEEKDGRTHLTVSERYPTKEALDRNIGSTEGLPEQFAQLDALLPDLA